MSLFRSFQISGSGLEASRQRLDAAAMNLANAESTAATPEQVYKPRRVRLGEAVQSFSESFWSKQRDLGVEAEVTQQRLEPEMIHDPSHPDSDELGRVYSAPVDVTQELTEMMAARRAYEAGLTAYGQARETFMSTLEILRS